MKIFVMTCDKYLKAIPGFAHFFNKYWSSEQQVIVAGYSPPQFSMPDNFTFFSIGNQADYPVGKWSNGLIQLMNSFPAEKHFVLMLEDYWLCQPVRIEEIMILYHYMIQFDYVLKMDLCADRRFAGGVEDYGNVAHIPLVKSDFNSAYHMSLMCGIWNAKQMRRVIIPNESPWDVEIIGTPRLAKSKDNVLVLGTKTDPWPLKHTLVYRSGNADKLLVDDMNESDRDKIRGLGYKF